jgi:hypothetical protein
MGAGWACIDFDPGVEYRVEGLTPVGGFRKDRVFVARPGLRASFSAEASFGVWPYLRAIAWLVLSPLLLCLGTLAGLAAWLLFRRSTIAYACVAYPASFVLGVVEVALLPAIFRVVTPELQTWFGFSPLRSDPAPALLGDGLLVALWVHSFVSPGPTKGYWLVMRSQGAAFVGLLLPWFYLSMFSKHFPTGSLNIVLSAISPALMFAGSRIRYDEPLTSRFATWCKRAKSGISDVYVFESNGGFASGSVRSGDRVIISNVALAKLSEKELDFVLAREATPTGVGLRRLSRPQTMFGAGLALGVVASIGLADLRHSWPALLLLFPAMIGMVVITVSLPAKRALQVDAEALDLTRDLPSAISAIEKIHREIDVKLDKRIASLRAAEG